MEWELIHQLKSSSVQDARVKLGIGDDSAIISQEEGVESVIATDMLLDGIHFLSDQDGNSKIARKALGVNVSDLAAMGSLPVAGFASLAIPQKWTTERVSDFGKELIRAAEEFGITLAGGDTNSWSGPFAINIAVYGIVGEGQAITRAGSSPGDLICVSGPLGGSILGKQFTFMPRVHEARWLAEHAQVHAMIDISDGLLSDLRHLLDAGNCGAELNLPDIPIAEDTHRMQDNLSPLEHALIDGEDFELLWTMPADELEKLLAIPDRPVEIFPIGTITSETECWLIDSEGNQSLAEIRGYEHKLG